MSTKKPMTPLERGTKKLDVLMRAFGMRTRVFIGKTRSIVKGTRKQYPLDVHASIIESARGIGIKIKLEKIWYTLLKLIPFFILQILAIIELAAPNVGVNISESIGINPLHLILGNNPSPIAIIVIMPIIGLIVVTAELLERLTRVRYLQNRMPRFLSGAEWKVAEPSVMLDTISASNNILWLSFIFMIVIHAPLSFGEDIYTKFLEVYKTDSAPLINKTVLISVLDIAIISGMLMSFLLMRYKDFRTSLDREQFRKDIKLDATVRELLYTVSGSLILATLELAVFYVTFWTNINAGTVLIFYAFTIVSSIVGTFLVWQNERYIFIALAIWLFLSDVVMIFLNANNPAYSWMIICHLFLILLILLLHFNLFMDNFLRRKGIYEPSWIFSPLPIFAYINFWTKPKVKRAIIEEKEWEELQEEAQIQRVKERPPLKINIEKIRQKGKDAEKLVQIYFKIISRIVKGEITLLTLSTVNDYIIKTVKDDKVLQQKAELFIETIDRLLWDDGYSLSDGKDLVETGEEIYKLVLKR